MSDTPVPAGKRYGPNLYEYLDKVRAVSAGDRSMRQFCLDRGLDDALMSKWRTSTGDVTIEQMRRFGECLDLRLGQVIVIAGYGTPEDLGEGAVPPEPQPVPPTTIEGLLREEFSAEEAQHVLHFIELLRGAQAGRSGEYSASPARRRTATRSR